MKKILYISSVLFLAISCRKEDVYDGPSLNDKFGPFEITKGLTLSQQTINFSTDGDLIFNAQFSKNVDFEIDITGANSGAHRKITGYGNVMSIDNATWEGGSDSFPGFDLEKAYIEVSFPKENTSETLKDSVVISGFKSDKGFLITSFESSATQNWSIDFNQATVTQSNICSDGLSAKQDCYYSWEGEVTWDWGIGGINISPSSGSFGLPANGNNLYFNMGVNFLDNVGLEGSSEASAFVITFQEDDSGDGIFKANEDDAYGYTIWSNPENIGWELLSLKYIDLQFDANGNKIDVNGNGLPEPNKIVNINIVLIGNPSGGNTKAFADHLIFTTDEPYRP